MDKTEFEELKTMVEGLSATLALVRCQISCLEVFSISALEHLGLRGTVHESLMDDLKMLQKAELSNWLKEMADKSPSLASSLRKHLEGHLPDGE